MSMTNVLRGLAKAALPAAVADGARARILTDLHGRGRDSKEDVAQNANRTAEVDPVTEHHDSKTDTLTNITTNTTGYLYYDVKGRRIGGLQGLTSGTTPTDVLTVTLEGTKQDDGTAPASKDWDVITLEYTGQVSWVDEDFNWDLNVPMPYVGLRIKYVTSNGGVGDCDLTVHSHFMQ
jgi:hypothetical protein